jgi:acyl carrier protein
MTHDEIQERVAQTLIQALGVSRSEIRPEASLVGDLEAESIDFLDIVFRLEKEFGIEIVRGELFPQEILRNPALVTNGTLTAAGVEAIRERFAFTTLPTLRAGDSVQAAMDDLLTVGAIVDYVESKVSATVPGQAQL